MLEPPTPAGEPFAAQEVDEANKTSADFESVCISLVERGWKIMPKKGTYPINKKGPRYINLVDPRGNRKSVRVIDENLWDKLRAAEAQRTARKDENSENSNKVESISPIDEIPREQSVISENFSAIVETGISNAEVEQISETPLIISQPLVENVVEATAPTFATEDKSIESSGNSEPQEIERQVEEISAIAPQPHEVEAKAAEVVENPPREFQNFAFSSPGLQKSIFELGFETLLTALQSETLTPTEIVTKIQEWSMESKNLLEFVHKYQEKTSQRSALPDNSEKEDLITELQSTLKETEDKLAETLKALREM